MDTKKIIIIIAIIAVIAAICGIFLLNNQVETTTNDVTIVLSKSAYMKVPDDPNSTSKADDDGIFYYKDAKDDLNITSSSNLSASSSSKEMKNLKNSVVTGSKKIKEDNVVVYEKNGTYSIFVKNTQYNDTLLIQSHDKNVVLSCWASIKYHNPSDKFKIDNTTSDSSGKVVDAIEQTQNAVEKASSTAAASSETTYSSSDYSFGDRASDFVNSPSSSSSPSTGDSLGDKASDFV